MNASYDFIGSKILVVGAASGIGRATAAACCEAGATVWAVDIDEAQLKTLPKREGLKKATLDISDSRACASLIAQILAIESRIDAAVFTSAIQRRSPIDETSNEIWQKHLDVNLSGIFYLLREVMPAMKRQRGGSIITFTSGLAFNGWPGAAAYATTKAGIVGLVKCAALELQRYGVRINAVSPGLVATPVFLKSATTEEVAHYEKSLGVSNPEAVVPTLMFLISNASASISGTVVERRLIPSTEAHS
jgi:NAD(P)-dependent dehydrogenase (short-subunit alcohol dehydrogenase family)